MLHRWLLWIILLSVLTGLLTLLMRSFITIKVDFHHHKDQDEGTLTITALWGLVRIKRKLHQLEVEPSKEGPALAIDHSQPQPNADQSSAARKRDKLTSDDAFGMFKHFQSWRALYRHAKPILRKLAAESQLESLEIQAVIGTGDAVSTGILCGSAWTIFYTVFGWICARVGSFNPPKASIQPAFRSLAWSLDGSCILKVRIGYATTAAFQLIRLWRRRKPHGTSHSRVNAYRHVEYP